MLPIIILAASCLFAVACAVSAISSIESKASCNVDFRVYVYDLSHTGLLKNAAEARANSSYHVCKKCIYEQFALEYVIFDYLTQFCGRTYDADEADFFYLPIVRDIDYRIALQSGQRAPSATEEALLDALEKQNTSKWDSTFRVTHKYWDRYQGADHIIVMPAPVTNLRHQSNMRGFFHYVRIVPYDDLRRFTANSTAVNIIFSDDSTASSHILKC
jgi:hypothetical protein